MAGATARQFHGATIAFPTSSYSFDLESLSHSGVTRGAVETTHSGTAAPGASTFGNRTFIPSTLSDPGSYTVGGHYDPDQIPIIDAVAETIAFNFALVTGDATDTILSASGFNTDFSWSGDTNAEATIDFSGVYKLSGNVTQTDAA